MIDIAHVLPVLEPMKAPDETGPRAPFGNEDTIVVRTWTVGIAVRYVVEHEGTHMFVRWRDLADMDAEKLHATAIANLADLAKRALAIRIEGGIARVGLDGRLDPSLLLLDAPWEDEIPRAVAPPLVVVAAARDVVAVATASKSESVDELKALAASVPRAARLLPNTLLLRRGRWWEPFSAPSA